MRPPTPRATRRWRPDPNSAKPLYRQVYERFREAIRQGVMRPEERLPSARSLASQLGAARGTVDLAYSLLAGEGYILSRGAAGTFVAPGLSHAPGRSPRRATASSTRGALRSGIPEKRVAPFQVGVPALDVFPRSLWCRLTSRKARILTMETMLGTDPTGYGPLREAIAAYLTVSRGIRCHAGQIIITSGFQGALALLTRAFLRPGDAVWLEEPGYFFAREALLAAGGLLVPVTVDEEGLNVDDALSRAPQARFAYVTPAHQAPLGVSLSLPRRLALLSWAARADAWIIEDDYDSEFRYGSRPLPALKSLDEVGRVLYVGTFSKVLFPGLRLGYLLVPDSEIGRVRQACELFHRGGATLTQAVVADFLYEGHLSRHIKRMRSLYQQRRAALASALGAVFGDRLTLRLQAGGMHLIGMLPQRKDDQNLVSRARAHGLAPAALSGWYIDKKHSESGLLFGFTNIESANALAQAEQLRRALRL